MMRRLLAGGLVGLVSFAGACGSDEQDKGEQVKGEPATLASYSEAWCEAMARCHHYLPDYLGGPSLCPERYRISVEAYAELPGSRFTDPGFLSSCVQSMRSASCEQVADGEMSVCTPPAGTLDEGSRCLVGAQCATGACTGETGCGTCVRGAELDEPCGPGKPCVLGLSCIGESGDSDKRCGKYRGPRVGDECKDCGGTLTCRNGVCSLFQELGGECSASSDCGSGAFCDSEKGVCSAVTRVGEGEACEGEGVDCDDGLFCHNGECEAYAADGEACGLRLCLFPAFCDSDTYVCTLLSMMPACE